MSNKNPSTKLYFSQFGGERPIPEKFIAAMERAEERQKVPLDYKLPPLSDEIIEARFDTRYENTNEKELVVIKKKLGVVGPLRDRRTTDQGQAVQVDATMFRTGDKTFEQAVPSATQDVSVADLGNGWSIQEVAVMGTYDGNGVFVPGLFQGIELETRRNDPIPDRFRAGLPTTQTQEIVEGIVEQPILGNNDLDASERQLAQHRKLLTRLTRDGVTLPFSLISKRTNERKQLVIVTDTYRIQTTAPVISELKDVQVLDLGEGHEVVTTEEIAAVFGNEAYTKQIEDLLPVRFRGLLPTTVTRQILTGAASMPTLETGELRRTEEQVTLLTKMVEVMSRAGVSFPITVVDKATITEYGGGEVTTTSDINVSNSYTNQEGEGVVSSKITQLGEDHELREVVARVAGSWPTLPFANFDSRLQLLITGTKQVVAKGSTTPGISAGVVTEVKEIDKYREQKIVTTQPLAGVDNYHRVLETTVNLDIPAKVISLHGYVEENGGVGSWSESGTYLLGNGHGSGGVQLRGNAQASAAMIPELGWLIRYAKTTNRPARHVLFNVASNANRATILAAAGAILGATVNDWPDFAPQELVLLLTGQKSNVNVTTTASAYDSVVSDYLGAMKFTGGSRTSGSGLSFEVGVNVKIVRISPTIHGDLSIDGTVTADANGGAGYTAAASINAGTSGAIVGLGSAAGAHSAIIPVTSLNATTGAADWPNAGLYAHRIVPEPDPTYDRLRVLMEVVDFANVYV